MKKVNVYDTSGETAKLLGTIEVNQPSPKFVLFGITVLKLHPKGGLIRNDCYEVAGKAQRVLSITFNKDLPENEKIL